MNPVNDNEPMTVPPGAPRRLLIVASTLIALLIALSIAVSFRLRLPPVPLNHSAYIWQREWSDGLREAMQRNQSFIAEWAVLAAEVEFRAHAAPHVARALPDYAALRDSGRPVSFAIRVAPYPGPFDRHRPET